MIPLLLARTEAHGFAFRREDVEEVLLLPRLNQRAGDISLIEGWLSLRGQGLPVISLATLLGLGQEPSSISDHLILTRQRPRVAWRVRRVSGLAEIGWESLQLLEHAAEPKPCYVAHFEWEGETINLVNVAGLLLAEEQQRLERAEEKRQARLGDLRGV